MVEALRYKLRTFAVNLEVPTEFYCDKNSVVTNYSTRVSLKQKTQHYMIS